ncbi:MAG: restriction endonuclease subunit S [Cyclobacteriaceae bacterium]
MELKEATYKSTEIGLIPEDWELRELKYLLKSKPSYGINAPAVDYKDHLPQYLRITDISDEGSYLKNGKVSVKHSDSNNFKLEEGDLVFARTGASVGKTYLYDSKDGELVYAGFLIKVSPDPEKLNTKLLFAFTRTQPYWNWVKVMSMRSGQPGINGNEYGSLKIPLPPTTEEQQAIATALSDVDTLISNLDKLIAKKKAIKQGAMQRLLKSPTLGGQRLPGFEGEWVEKRVSQIMNVSRGGSPRPIQAFMTHSQNGINWIKIGDTEKNGKYITSSQERIIPEGEMFSRKVNIGDFLLSNSMSFGRPYILKIDGCVHDGWLVLQNYQTSLDTEFLYYLLTSNVVYQQYMSKAAGSGVLNLNKELVKTIDLVFPKTLDEQQAIAKVLFDMDKEIESIETKKSKYLRIKQGMMQELLTGKTRLV